jgi:uroporphyrin-III C-methyltransferase
MHPDTNSSDRGRALGALRSEYPVFTPGEVWLVGAGPGGPGLLTLDALAGLIQADVLVHDALVDQRVLALARSDAQVHFAGKRGGRPSTAQADISGEEILALAAARVPFRVVPGVTSGLGALASAGIPATMRGINQAVILVTGHGALDEDGVDWASLARTRQPIVLYMGLRNLESIADQLMRGGLAGATAAAVIASATLAEERVLVTSLERVAGDALAANLAAPAIVVIGEVVNTRQRLLQMATSFGKSPCEN